MTNAGQPSAPFRPSVFISYSSEDRAAARALRDALSAAGLEVWYDENELGGGDAWDQKIRRQIRDCDYFMPVISASTERRKEGYFRREWRLACDRSMDMADDVLFLLPVVIDGTSEGGARVPDKFVTVQWIRTPDGAMTPALEALTKRLIAGEHTVAPRAPLTTRPGTQPPMMMTGTVPPMPPPVAPPSGPPPMPPFPHHEPNSGHWPKYVAEVIWWGVSAVWLIFNRLPKPIRVILTIWIAFMLISTCRNSGSSSNRDRPKSETSSPVVNSSDIKDAIKIAQDTANEARAAGKDRKQRNVDVANIGAEMARRFGKMATLGKTVAFVPHETDHKDPVAEKFGEQVFSNSFGKFILARPGEATVSTVMPTGDSDEALAKIGQRLGIPFIVGFHTTRATDGAASIEVHLVRTADGTLAWSDKYPVADANPNEVGAKIAEAVIAALPEHHATPQPPAAPPPR